MSDGQQEWRATFGGTKGPWFRTLKGAQEWAKQHSTGSPRYEARVIGGGEPHAASETLNEALHRLVGAAEACETACTHIIVDEWTALGLANVANRAVSKATTSEGDA